MPQAEIATRSIFCEIERQLHRQRHPLVAHVEIMRERVADDLGLLVDFLRHEMAVVALVDQERRGVRFQHRALDHLAVGVVHLDALARHHRPVAVFEIADGVGERRERDRVGAEIHLAVAVADRERRALAGADQQILLAGEQEGEREGAAQPRQRGLDRLDRRACRLFISSVTRCATTSVSVSLRNFAPFFSSSSRSSRKFSMMPLCTTASFSVACGCALFSVGLPWVAQRVWPMPIGAVQRLAVQPRLEIAELALGAPARQRAAFERGDAGGIVAAIFEALERIDKLPRHRLAAENSNNPAQGGLPPRRIRHTLVMRRRRFPENQNACPDVTKRGH